MLYAAMPPLPWVPEVTRTEGKYLFVNKNLVEMLALLVLATSRTGYWIGLDGLVSYSQSISPPPSGRTRSKKPNRLIPPGNRFQGANMALDLTAEQKERGRANFHTAVASHVDRRDFMKGMLAAGAVAAGDGRRLFWLPAARAASQ